MSTKEILAQRDIARMHRRKREKAAEAAAISMLIRDLNTDMIKMSQNRDFWRTVALLLVAWGIAREVPWESAVHHVRTWIGTL